MLPTDTQQHLEQITGRRRRTIGLAAAGVATTLTVIMWIQTLLAGDTSLTLNYLLPIFWLLGLGSAVFHWGVRGPIFPFLALTVIGGFLCTLFLPGAHGAHILLFFSAVPLLYILGGAVGGRIASAAFLAVTFILLGLRLNNQVFFLPPPIPGENLLAAFACLVLQFVMAEANEREHRHRLLALADHQLREPNSNLPNRNALARQTVGPGRNLLLVKFGNPVFEESWQPGRLGRALEQLGFPGHGLYWIAEDQYALLESDGPLPPGSDRAEIDRRLAGELPGTHSRAPVQIVCVQAGERPEPASRLLVEAELQMAVGSPTHLADQVSACRVQDMVRALRTCFQERRLSAVFQPIYDAEAGGIAVLEGLTRLDLDGKPVSPEAYLGLIETLGLDRQLTEFILDEAVRMGQETGYSVSLNLTYRDLEDTGFLPRILDACALFRHRDNKLILELTEHIAFSDQQLLSRFITRVHEAGGLVFLDDFGMGYSNYASIVSARFDAIKVAGSIVRQAPASAELRILLSGVAEFARASGIGLVAEHISDQEICDMVRGEGIRYLQGYLLQKPVSGPKILAGELSQAVNSLSTPFGTGKAS